MNSASGLALFGLIYLGASLGLATYVFAKELITRPRTEITRYRFLLMSLFGTAFAFILPSIIYQYQRWQGRDIESLRNFVTALSNPRSFALGTAIFIVVFYKVKFKD